MTMGGSNLQCNANTKSFECFVCGTGQGFGPLLKGEYGYSSFTTCFQSVVSLGVLLFMFMSWGFWKWKIGQQKASNGRRKSSDSGLADDDRFYSMIDDDADMMISFAEERKGENERDASKYSLEQPKNSRLGVTDRGSEVYQTAVSFALDNAMKDAEGAALPRALIAVTFLLFLSTAAFPFAPRMNDGKNLINSEERSHWLTYASSVPIAVGWLYVAAAFFRSHALGWFPKPLHWFPGSVGTALSILQLFHGYNFVVPYMVGHVQFPWSALTAALMVGNLSLTVLFVILWSTINWRHRSSPLYLLNAETAAFMSLEKQRVNGTKPYVRLLTMCKVDYLLFVFGCLGGLCATLSNIGWQVCFGRMLRSVISQDKDGLVDALQLQIVSCVGLYAGNSLQLCFVEAAGTRLVTRIQRFVFMAMVEQDMSFYDKNKSGELTTMLTSNTALIRTGMTTQLAQAFRGVFQFVIILVYLLSNDLDLTLVFLGTAMVPLVVLGCSLTLISKLSNESAEAQNVQGGIAQEFLSGIRTVVSFVMQEGAKNIYDKSAWYANKIGVRLVVVQGLAFSIVFGGFYGALTVALWYGCNDVITKGAHDPSYVASQTPRIVIFLQMAIAMVMGLGWIIGGLPEVAKAVGASKKLFEILDRQPLVNYRGGKRMKKDNLRGNIVLEDVTFVYPTRPDKVVLEHFHLSIREGETVALVGQSGSGKSTVLGMIERFYDPVKGSVRLDGVDIRLLDPMWLRQQIGFVMQEPTLFAGTISENIRFGCEWIADAVMVEAAEQANAHDFILGLPDGYDTVVGENGTSLSGGQKQRIAIARAILKNPKILLLDEATSALDAKSEKLVQDALDKLMHGRTTVVVAHRLSTIVNANKIHVFSNGTIAESGTHRSLLEKNGIYANLISKQRGDVHPSNKLSLGSVHTPRLDTEGAVAATAAKPAELRINVRPKSNRPSNSPFTSWDGKMEPVEQADPPSRPPLHYQPRNIGKSRSASSSPSRKRGGSINS